MGALTADPATLPIGCSYAPVWQVIHRAISTLLIKQAGLKRIEAQTGAMTLIQRFGSAANPTIHLHGLVLDGVYHIQDGVPEFHGVWPPTAGPAQLDHHAHHESIHAQGRAY